MKCFYHSADLCSDGHCAGAIVKMKYPDCEMIGIDYYRDEFPWDRIAYNPNQKIFMVDFSLQPFNQMMRLYNLLGRNLIWIDHHKSAITEDDKQPIKIEGLREIGTGACELTWRYCYPDKPVPRAVKLLADYDVWKHDDPDCLPFQYGMRIEDTNPENSLFWQFLLDINFIYSKIFPEILTAGVYILKYRKKTDAQYMKLNAFQTDFEGLECIAVNFGEPYVNSLALESVWNEDEYAAMLTFCRRKSGWEVNLYTNRPDVDVSEIAKHHGGGGHKQAAGFQCSELPFKL